jgi:hypothetical protein
MISPVAQAVVGGWGLGMSNFDAVSLLDPALVKLMGMDDLSILERTRFLEDVNMSQLKIWNAMWSRVKAAP